MHVCTHQTKAAEISKKKKLKLTTTTTGRRQKTKKHKENHTPSQILMKREKLGREIGTDGATSSLIKRKYCCCCWFFQLNEHTWQKKKSVNIHIHISMDMQPLKQYAKWGGGGGLNFQSYWHGTTHHNIHGKR